ncbi:MAG: RHS repeat domain-containing protein, partial [Fimbriimonadaceae bacterium]
YDAQSRINSVTDNAGKMTGFEFDSADNLVQINRGLLRHWPDLEITDQQWAEMDDYVSRKPNRPSIDLTQRTVYRVFNNGTFEDGGRFYGGWWQSVPKAYRPYIPIDGKQTVEVDYSSMHPTILYAELGIPMPDDPYAFGSFDRQVVKRTINALLNAKSTNIKPVEGFSELAFGIRWSEFLAAVKTHAHDLEPYFGTGYGLKLQRLDSDIAEEVMLEFARSRIPILPVHDSFLVHHGNEDVLKLRMQERFRARVGVDVKLKTVILDEQVRIGMRRRGEATTTDLKELLELPGPYMAHDRRVAAWFTWKDSRAARKPLTDGTAYPLD